MKLFEHPVQKLAVFMHEKQEELHIKHWLLISKKYPSGQLHLLFCKIAEEEQDKQLVAEMEHVAQLVLHITQSRFASIKYPDGQLHEFSTVIKLALQTQLLDKSNRK